MSFIMLAAISDNILPKVERANRLQEINKLWGVQKFILSRVAFQVSQRQGRFPHVRAKFSYGLDSSNWTLCRYESL